MNYPKHMLRPVRTTREAGGFDADGAWYHTHTDFEAKCCECGRWSEDYGDVDIIAKDGSALPLCNPCADRLDEAEAALAEEAAIQWERRSAPY